MAGGTRPGTLLFGGTLLGDVAAAAGGGACGSVLGLVVVVPVVQVVLRAVEVVPCCSSSTGVTSLAVCWWRRLGWRQALSVRV